MKIENTTLFEKKTTSLFLHNEDKSNQSILSLSVAIHRKLKDLDDDDSIHRFGLFKTKLNDDYEDNEFEVQKTA